MLFATTTLWRFDPPAGALLALLCDYTPSSVRPSGGYDPPPTPSPAWLAELTPEARAIVAPRLIGQQGGGD